MATTASGEIGIVNATNNRNISVQLGIVNGTQLDLNNADLRTLAGITTPGAQISFSSLLSRPAVGQSEYTTAGTFSWVAPVFELIEGKLSHQLHF